MYIIKKYVFIYSSMEALMKSVRKWFVLAGFLFVQSLFSCKQGVGDGESFNVIAPINVDFTNYGDGGQVKISYGQTGRLIATRGDIDLKAGNVIGGIRAPTDVWGLKNSKLISGTSQFVMSLYRYEDIMANLSDLSLIRNQPLTRVMVYYNEGGAESNPEIFDLSSKLGGENRIIINHFNAGSFNAIFHQDSPYGKVFAYVGANTMRTTIPVSDGDLYLVIGATRYSSYWREPVTTFARYADGKLVVLNRAMGPAPNGSPEWTINISDYLNSLQLTSGSAYLLVRNNSSTHAVYFSKGGTIQRTASGGALINPGSFRLFELPMDRLGTGSEQRFSDSVTIPESLFSFGTDAGSSAFLGETEFSSDHLYELTVTGTSVYNFSISSFIDKGVKDFTSDTAL
jgi:hypothetical protein